MGEIIGTTNYYASSCCAKGWSLGGQQIVVGETVVQQIVVGKTVLQQIVIGRISSKKLLG